MALILLVSCNSVTPLLEKGEANLLLGDFARAEQYFARAVDASPHSRRARIGLGKALLQRHAAEPANSLLLNASLIQLEAARSIAPDSTVEKLLSMVWFARANSLVEGNDTLAALAALSRSIALDKKATRPLNLAGILYFHRGESSKARTLFTMVIGIDSLSATGYFNAGMVDWAEKNFTRAYENWFKAAQRAPDDKELVLWAARAKGQIGAGVP